MFQIICGEDTAKSRAHFNQLRAKYLEGGIILSPCSAEEIYTLVVKQVNLNLFNQKIGYSFHNLDNYLRKIKKSETVFSKIIKILNSISKDQEQIVVDWEDGKAGWELSIIKKYGQVKEFRPDFSIFALLAACYPTNKLNFLKILQNIEVDEYFIFAMLVKHIKSLIMASNNLLPAKLPPWQRARLDSQAKKWDINQLTSFYQTLHRVETQQKTGFSPYNLRQSLDITASYYL